MNCRSNNEHFTLVKSGNESVNVWRRENPDAQLKLSGFRFKDLAIGSLDLSGADLEGATFVNCDLPDAIFKKGNLKATTFYDCRLPNTNFVEANLKNTIFSNVNLSDAEFGDNATIAGIKHYSLSSDSQNHPKYEASKIPFWDRFMSWDKLRFLRSINIFVPSYAALVLSVLYLNGLSTVNYTIQYINDVIANSPEMLGIETLGLLNAGVRHFWIVTAFFCLAVASTFFLACPSRIIDYSREQWESEVKKSPLGYDYACWSRRWARIPCIALLLAGGLITAILLLVLVCNQVTFIFNYSLPNEAQ